MGRGPRHRKPPGDDVETPGNDLKRVLASKLAIYEQLKNSGALARALLDEIEAIRTAMEEGSPLPSRSRVRGTAAAAKARRSRPQIRPPGSKSHPPRTQIMYIECKTDRNDRGGARIGRVTLSKTGRTLYYGGLVLQSLKGQGIGANYHNVNTGLQYWCSRPKKNGKDRHWAGSGTVAVDADVVDEYWREIRGCEPPENPFVT